MRKNTIGVVVDLRRRIPEPRLSELDRLYYDITAKKKPEKNTPELLLKYLNSGEGLILDVGCGCGHLAAGIASRTKSKVVGIDNYGKAIKRAKQLYGKQKNLSFEVADVYQLKGKYRDVGLLTCEQSLHHFDNLNKALDQMISVLHPKGTLFIQDFDRRLGDQQMRLFIRDPRMVELYVKLTSGNADEIKAFLQRTRLINDRHIITFFSLLAGYKSDEVTERLNRKDFDTLCDYQRDKATYLIIAGRKQ
jgi:ubiquinone/menaquinone biosynthesis C-methylase UbiE